MPTFEQEQKAKQDLYEVLAQLAAIKATDLVRAADLGKDLNFGTGVPVFERTLKLFQDLHQSNLDNVSYDVLLSLKGRADDALEKFNKIKTFSPLQQQQNPGGARDGLITTLRDQYANYFSVLSPIIAYSIRKGTDFEALEKQARDTLGALERTKIEYAEKQSNILSEMDSTLQKVRLAAAQVGVAQHATHFKEEADEHSKQAKWWLWATICSAIATIGWGAVSFFIHPPTETAQIIQFAVGKLIILSALYYALVWCARNYNAHRHNYVVNKHRQNSLSTFETFAKAAGDDIDTKNAVLIQTTFSIFASQSTGYVQKDSESDTPNKFIEILRSASSSVQKSS